MASNFSFPLMKPAEIVEALRIYGIAPSPSLRADDIVNPQPGFVAPFLANFVNDAYLDEQQLQFQALALQVLDNPEHHIHALAISRIYKMASAFLHSIQFPDLKLRDLLRADGRRVTCILSALINFLYYRQERLGLLEPITQEFATLEERLSELTAKIAMLRKAKEDHLLKEQMEAPVVRLLEKEVNELKQKLHDFNREQLLLRVASKAIDDNKEEILRKVININMVFVVVQRSCWKS